MSAELSSRLRALTEAPRILKGLVTHEAARTSRLGPLRRFASWQVRKRRLHEPVVLSVFDGGARLRCHPDSAASNAVVYFGWPDWHEMRLLRDVLRPGDGFLDIGANVGVYSVLAASKVLPGGRVLAFEPEPSVLDRLRENLELNGLDPAGLHPVALGADAGSCLFEVGRDSLGGVANGRPRPTVSVTMERLDNLVEPSDDLAVGKIDVEGYELAVLKGAKRLLEERLPRCWIVETNPLSRRYGDSRGELWELFASYGFDLYEVTTDPHRITAIGRDGPFPQNSLAVGDLAWLQARVPTLEVVTAGR